MSAVSTVKRDGAMRGLAAVCVFLGIPLVLLALTIGNTVRWLDATGAATASAERVAQIESRIRGRTATPQADTSALFLAAATGSLARAELQQRLAGLVERAGGRLIEVRGDEEPEAAAQRSIVLRLSLDIGNAGLFDLLTAIETGLPILTVETATIRPVPSRGSGTDEADPALRVALSVRGYQREARP